MTDRFVAVPVLGGAPPERGHSVAGEGRGAGDAAFSSRARGSPEPVADRRIQVGGGVVSDVYAEARLARIRTAAEFGPLAPYLMGTEVTDLFVNGEGGLWVDRGTGLERDRAWRMAERPLRELAVRLIALGGRHV